MAVNTAKANSSVANENMRADVRLSERGFQREAEDLGPSNIRLRAERPETGKSAGPGNLTAEVGRGAGQASHYTAHERAVTSKHY